MIRLVSSVLLVDHNQPMNVVAEMNLDELVWWITARNKLLRSRQNT